MPHPRSPELLGRVSAPGADASSPHSPSAEPGRALAPALAVSADPEQETDLWYGGYAGRATLPNFVLCCLWTAAVFGLLKPWLDQQMPDDPQAPQWLAFGCAAAAWLFSLVQWLYCKLTIELRLTTRRVVVCRGFVGAWCDTPIRQIAQIDVLQNLLHRWADIGRVILTTNHSPPQVYVLPITVQPHDLAARIQRVMAEHK